VVTAELHLEGVVARRVAEERDVVLPERGLRTARVLEQVFVAADDAGDRRVGLVVEDPRVRRT
jgi:hypothetical protein